MGGKAELTQATGSKSIHKQRVSRNVKEVKGTMLAKRVSRESNEEMVDVEGSKKRRVVSHTNLSVEADDQSC